MTESESHKEIRKICLRLLARREYSQLELLTRLTAKGFDRLESQGVVDGLVDEGWQSDDRFAEAYARYRIKKGYGPIKISYELRQRGIEAFDLETVVLDLADSWFEILEQVYDKKYADNNGLSNKEWQKRSRFLQQRGFSHEIIKTLYKQTM
ncbi:MAG: regulatory protein RecX [Methylococcaceae bacterium]